MTTEFSTALELIRQLDNTFIGTQTLIVGGAVRDHILGLEPHDVDLATNIPFKKLGEWFELNDITKNTLNPQPVSIITFKGIPFEIASFRTDSIGTDRASNVATIVDTFEEDSKRRDITINAMGLNSLGEIIDPQNGQYDLRNRIIRCVGDPNQRFEEDATRILRVFRFAAKFEFRISQVTLKYAIRNRDLLSDRSRIAPESIAKEFFKAASSGKQLAVFIQMLDEAKILDEILPEWTALEGFTHDPIHHPEANGSVQGHILCCLRESLSKDPVTNLAILFHDLGKATTRGVKDNGHSNYHGHEDAGVPIAEGIFERLRFNDLTAEDKENILFCVARHMLIHNINDLSAKTLTRLVLNPGWDMLKEVGYADHFSRIEDASVHERVEFGMNLERVEKRVKTIAESRDHLRLTVKRFIDGNKVMDWFPITHEQPKLLGPILAAVTEFIIEELDAGNEPSQDELRNFAERVLSTL